MAHLVQVGAGSGGMVVLDLVARDPRITRVTLIEPDVYKPHNAERHYFGPQAAGRLKADLAVEWLRQFRPELPVRTLVCDVTDPAAQPAIEAAVRDATLGVCAVDREPAKFHWDQLMRTCARPWTLGEVLSGGIGGFVHIFTPGGPCYGCVASFLQRSVAVEQPAVPDYSQPGGGIEETTVPASKASIHAIASWHAVVTLRLLEQVLAEPSSAPGSPGGDLDFTSLLVTLQRVPDVFDEALRPHRFRVPRMADCLICRPGPAPSSSENLDVALDQALARLGNA
jgi:hypothetical protein